VVDAIDNDALRTMAAACADMPLITAGSGVALGLPAVYEAQGWLKPDAEAARLPSVGGRAAVLSGSCSSATNAQVAHWIAQGRPAIAHDARAWLQAKTITELPIREAETAKAHRG